MNDRWAIIGMPEEEFFEDLRFSIPTRKTIAVVARQAGPLRLTSLYARGESDDIYRCLTPRTSDRDFRDPVLSTRAPFVFSNQWRLEKLKDGAAGVGGDWVSVVRIDLNSNEISEVIRDGGIKISEPHVRSWIARLLNVSDDGKILYCSLAIELEYAPAIQNATKKSLGTHVEYWSSAIDTTTGAAEKISHLKATFV